MLLSVDSGKCITTIPHKKDYDFWMKNLNNNDYKKISDELNSKIDGSDINTSSWIPGSNWIGTVFEPIYYACNQNINQAGMFFGLILFDIMIQRPEMWGFGKYEKDGVPIKGTTYFLLDNNQNQTS